MAGWGAMDGCGETGGWGMTADYAGKAGWVATADCDSLPELR